MQLDLANHLPTKRHSKTFLEVMLDPNLDIYTLEGKRLRNASCGLQYCA